MDAQPFKRGLHAKCVHDRGQHPHVIGRGALHPLCRALKPAKDVAAANDHADLNTHVMHRFHFAGDAFHRRRMQAKSLIPHERLAEIFKSTRLYFVEAVPVSALLIRCPRFNMYDWPPKWSKIGKGSMRRLGILRFFYWTKAPANATRDSMTLPFDIPTDRPVLIAGPTASANPRWRWKSRKPRAGSSSMPTPCRSSPTGAC